MTDTTPDYEDKREDLSEFLETSLGQGHLFISDKAGIAGFRKNRIVLDKDEAQNLKIFLNKYL